MTKPKRPICLDQLEFNWMQMENEKYPRAKRIMKTKILRSNIKHQSVILCQQAREPSQNLSDYTIWLHGPSGMGKTTLSSMFPDSHLFCFGDQAKAIKANYVVIQQWEDFDLLVNQFKQSHFKTATVDLVEVAYDMCFQYVLNDLKIDYPGIASDGKKDFGKSWFLIRKAFANVLIKLMSLTDNQGLILISNSIMGERTSEEGAIVEDCHPNLSPRALNFISGSVDIVGFYHLYGRQRYLQIRPTENVMAKCRLEDNFLWTNGKPIIRIPMGENKKQAYNNFVSAFKNELEQPIVSTTITGKKK